MKKHKVTKRGKLSKRRAWGIAVVAIVVVGAIGTLLGSAWVGTRSEEVVIVTGKVTHKEKPVPGMLVTFVPQTGGSKSSTGTTDENGEFTLTLFGSGEAGAVVGTHKVCVSLPRTPPGGDDKKKNGKVAGGKSSTASTQIPEKYTALATTPLIFDIQSDQVINIQLD
jgi:hypothetical protein